jgi:hypothetical protein
MKFNKQLPVYLLLNTIFIASTKDDENKDRSKTNTNTQCAIKITLADAQWQKDTFIFITFFR